MDIHQLTDIFCQIDDFCNTLDAYGQNYMLTGPMKGKRGPSCGLAISEVMTILLMFQSSRMRDFKNFYTQVSWKCYVLGKANFVPQAF